MSHPVGWIASNAQVVIFKYNERSTILEIVLVDAVWRTGPTKGFRLKHLDLYFPKHRQTLQSPYDNSSSSVLNDTFVDGTMAAPCYMCTPLTLCGPVIDRSWPCVIFPFVYRIGTHGAFLSSLYSQLNDEGMAGANRDIYIIQCMPSMASNSLHKQVFRRTCNTYQRFRFEMFGTTVDELIKDGNLNSVFWAPSI